MDVEEPAAWARNQDMDVDRSTARARNQDRDVNDNVKRSQSPLTSVPIDSPLRMRIRLPGRVMS
jgi:hypothetical protein